MGGNPLSYSDPKGLCFGLCTGLYFRTTVGAALPANGGSAIPGNTPALDGLPIAGGFPSTHTRPQSSLIPSLPPSMGELLIDLTIIYIVSLNDDEECPRPNTLEPGAHAGDSIPARGPGRNFTPEERQAINGIGGDSGCHTCGTQDPGTQSGNFVPDHQPPNALNPDGGVQDLYPHCIGCSRSQGGQVSGLRRGNKR